MKAKGNIIIISGPSGAGEDSIINGLEKLLPIERVITTTSREKRPGETEKDPYYFISKEAFEKGIKDGDFFEHAKHYNDQYYGVTTSEIERVKQSEHLGVWKIDYKGVIKAKELMPDIPAIFVNAPLEILEQRIRGRKDITEAYVQERMAYTKEWLQHLDMYDYSVVNEQGKLNETIAQIKAIIDKEFSS